jgi:pantetheine-phosphate adenylyltransferase
MANLGNEAGPRALYGGSFDPPTNGHVDIIERTARIFPHVEVHVAVNPDKEPFFSAEKRLELLEEITEPLGNVAVGHSSSGFLVEYARENGFTTLVRGLRTDRDFGEEMNLLKMNKLISPEEVDTIYIPCKPNYEAVSSSAIKQILATEDPRWKEIVAQIVPELVLAAIIERQAAIEPIA